MKKILFLIILIFTLASCSKTENVVKDENITTQKNSLEELNIETTNPKIESVEEEDNSKTGDIVYFDAKKQAELTKELEDVISYGTITDIDCKTKYNFELNTKEDKDFISGLQKKCETEKSKVIKELDKKIKERIESVTSFKIEKCESIAKEKYAYMKDMKKSEMEMFTGRGEEFSYESEVARETEYCEQAYAFQYGCELLLDQSKKQKCLDMKDFQKKYMDLERYQNFVIGNYLR